MEPSVNCVSFYKSAEIQSYFYIIHMYVYMYVSVYSYPQLVYRMSMTIEELLVYREAKARPLHGS